jgi:hypothetical protein
MFTLNMGRAATSIDFAKDLETRSIIVKLREQRAPKR